MRSKKRERILTFFLKTRSTTEFSKNLNYFTLTVLIFMIFYISNTKYLFNDNFKIVFNMTINNRSVLTMNQANSEHPSYEVKGLNYNSSQQNSGNSQELKYILLWTTDTATPFIYFGKGQSVFIKKKCQWTNCFVTSDRNYLGFYTEFDVIAFNGPQLANILEFSNIKSKRSVDDKHLTDLIFVSGAQSAVMGIHDVPKQRSIYQKYVYANIEAADNYPIRSNLWNGFFNWTWTYKLNSDATWGYVAVRNASKHIVAPKLITQWMNTNEMDPIDNKLKERLKTKTKAAAWFVSNCYTLSRREYLARQIRNELHKYNLEVDIYGSCGKFQCPRNIMSKCLKLLQKRYYFYFAFENALNEDYVTEKIVYALKYDTVPVVYGGANYSRFMPDGIYLNALQLGPQKLAQRMYEIMQDPDQYYNFFRWKKYYSFHYRNEQPDTDDYCHFCKMVNSDKLMKASSVYEHFNVWWTGNITENNK